MKVKPMEVFESKFSPKPSSVNMESAKKKIMTMYEKGRSAFFISTVLGLSVILVNKVIRESKGL